MFIPNSKETVEMVFQNGFSALMSRNKLVHLGTKPDRRCNVAQHKPYARSLRTLSHSTQRHYCAADTQRWWFYEAHGLIQGPQSSILKRGLHANSKTDSRMSLSSSDRDLPWPG
ncbi:hypothetical protein AVEN_108778-1 [Araneus ventricosus]|uniref:Uncharacterized protein n=1 Tax=Araneus ventricosus TaxID=182803 RepID=A0A4Y2G6R4_ARAVE|nr:hypothetical protein AVEN_108778-1 [Araneus ventricosus]